MTGTVLSFPIPPYSNVNIVATNYNPNVFTISGISLGVKTTVTTIANMNFALGQLVRLLIPQTFGCYQLNQKTGYVLSIPTTNSVVIGINSVGVDPFIASSATTVAQIAPVGDVNNGSSNSARTNQNISIPGSFINVSNP